jgi:tetratricopeptide (TPR) repeat protein
MRSGAGAVVAILLAAGPSAAQSPAAALLAAGDSLWAAGAVDAARVRYDSLLALGGAVNTRALYRTAVAWSWRAELDSAIALHRRYVALEPADLEGRVALGRVLAWAGRTTASVAEYDAVLAREADYRDAALGRATALAWAGRYTEALATYERWIAAHPQDREAALERAKVLAWAGRLDQSLAAYRAVADAGDAAEAEKGIARVTAWSGELLAADAEWRAVTAKYPDDAEAWVGRAQVERWLGRPRAARSSLDRARALRPQDADVRRQFAWVRAELAPSGAPRVTRAGDSDGNGATMVDAAVGWSPADRHRATAAVRHVAARLAPPGAPEETADATTGRVGWRWQSASGRATMAGDLGAVRLSAATSVTRPLGGARAGLDGDRVSVGLGVSRTAFDEVARTIANGVVADGADADATFRLARQVALVATGGVARVTPAADTAAANRRVAWSAGARYTLRRGSTLAVQHRAFAFDDRATAGYFAPARFGLTEVVARLATQRELGWFVNADLGLGRQGLRPHGGEGSARFVARGAAAMGYRVAPGREFELAATFADVAGPNALQGSDYRYGALTLGGRWTR